MNIEIKHHDKSVDIIESVVREYNEGVSDRDGLETYFQANILLSDLEEEDTVCCSFSYYSESGEFIGLDNESEWLGDITLKAPYSLSFLIHPPKETNTVKCHIGVKRCDKSSWNYIWPVFIFLIFSLLISAIINLWI